MEYSDNDNTEVWDWQGEDTSNSLWSNVNDNQADLSDVFNETTPARSLEDLAYQNNENMIKGTEAYREVYSHTKRRRMLHFDDEVLDVDTICDEDLSSMFLKSKEREASLDGALYDVTEWIAGFADDNPASGSGYEGLDQSSEGWLADCLNNDTEMHLDDNDLNPSGSAAVPIDLTGLNSPQPENGGLIGQEVPPTPTRQNIIFKGKRSLIKTPTKVTSSVVLPFAFVKPCGMQGAITLKDINQKILTPPSSKPKKTLEDPAKSYPTSAFSGKPVVGKTKIRTEGGKGSITIMRTKG